jgi:hypothetical protein
LRLRLVGSPHVHSSCLGPVSFAGFLIKWITPLGLPPQLPPFGGIAPRRHTRPSYAVWALPPVGWWPRTGLFCVLSRQRPQPRPNCIAPALFTYVIPAYAHFPPLTSALRWWWRLGHSPFCGISSSPWRRWPIFSMTYCIGLSGCAAAACRARCCVCICCSLIYHCVHLRSLSSLTPCRPRRLPQPRCRALQFRACVAFEFAP